VENISSSKLFTTRQGTVLLGVIAAIIAAIALIVYLNHYRNSVRNTGAPIQVLVAQKLIQKDTPGDVLRTNPSYYEATPIAKSNVETGAIVDPATLAGKVVIATDGIAPGQQLTAADFGPAGTTVATQLNPNQRAVVVALGSPQEVGGQIGAGSHVDVWVSSSAQGSNGVSRPAVKLLFQDMYVLNAGAEGGNVTLRANPKQAGQLIYASSNASIWLALRPTIGTVSKKPPVISASNVTGG
jgi:Flp pilus assembly protein CpaB